MIDPQRLRDLAETLDGDDWEHPLGSAALVRDAADEIERLRSLVRELSQEYIGHSSWCCVNESGQGCDCGFSKMREVCERSAKGGA